MIILLQCCSFLLVITFVLHKEYSKSVWCSLEGKTLQREKMPARHHEHPQRGGTWSSQKAQPDSRTIWMANNELWSSRSLPLISPWFVFFLSTFVFFSCVFFYPIIILQVWLHSSASSAISAFITSSRPLVTPRSPLHWSERRDKYRNQSPLVSVEKHSSNWPLHTFPLHLNNINFCLWQKVMGRRLWHRF